MKSVPHQVTTLLKEWSDGDGTALEQLMPLVYDELHRLAHKHMRREGRGHIGPDHPGLGESLDHCACALTLNDQPDEAKQYRERANKIRNFAVGETLRQPHGVLQGAAIVRVEPEYPLGARQAGVRGSVIVQATVDECGKVINAFAISGPAELRPAAEKAARGWRFTPTRLAARPVKVIGTITFNFNL